MLFCCGILVLSKDKQNKRKGEKKMFKIYVKVTPISQWKYIGKTNSQAQANKIFLQANAKGYYCKVYFSYRRWICF